MSDIYEENQHLKRMPPMLSDIAIRDLSSGIRAATEHEAWVLAKYVAKDRGINSKMTRGEYALNHEGEVVSAPIPERWKARFNHCMNDDGEWCCQDLIDAVEEVAALDAQVRQLREALAKYGDHRDRCGANFRGDHPCTCGLSAVLAATEPK